MTIEKARRLLGEQAAHLSDDQISSLVRIVKTLSDVCADVIDNKIKKEGTNFLYMEENGIKLS